MKRKSKNRKAQQKVHGKEPNRDGKDTKAKQMPQSKQKLKFWKSEAEVSMCINISEKKRNADIDANDETGDLLANMKTKKKTAMRMGIWIQEHQKTQKSEFRRISLFAHFH